MNIVLAHGVLGFGRLAGQAQFVNYFNGVAPHLQQQGHTVLEPQVNPVGSIAQRGRQLAASVAARPGITGPWHIFAHSMGGLDARYALANEPEFQRRVKALVTIGTPHAGSPVADAIETPTLPLLAHIPDVVKASLMNNAGALHDLTTAGATAFSRATPDVPGVRYIEVAGNAALGDDQLFLFELAARIGKLQGQTNDGVVTRSSALRPDHEHLDDWPVDHAGEIGWVRDPLVLFVPPPTHLRRYAELLRRLTPP